MNKNKVLAEIYLKYRIIIFPFVVAVSCLILIVLVIFPQLSKLIGEAGKEKDLLSEVNTLDVKAQTLNKYDGEILGKQIKLVLSSYPIEADFGNVLGVLQNIGSGLGFSINSFGVGKANADKAGFNSYSVEISVSGPASLLPKFLEEIENSSRIMRISSIDITQSSESGKTDGSIAIQAYFAPPPVEFGKLNSDLPEITASDEATINRLAEHYGDVPASDTSGIDVSTGNPNPFQ